MRNFPFFALFLAIFCFTSCTSSVETHAQQTADGKVTIADFKAKLAKVPNAQLVDVRTPEEFSRGSLDGAVNMNFRADDLETQLNTLDKNKPVFIFCQAGGRSGKCYKKMKDMGFKEVYDMEGGYGEWSKK